MVVPSSVNSTPVPPKDVFASVSDWTIFWTCVHVPPTFSNMYAAPWSVVVSSYGEPTAIVEPSLDTDTLAPK